jgi:hypothetical protein
MELSGKIDPAIERTLTASAPRTPTAVGESYIDRTERLAPPTPVPTARTYR